MESRALLIVFSHLRWDFVYQRPQHLISRLARKWKVLFFEEPIYDPDQPAHLERSSPAPNIEVCRPHTPLHSPGYSDAQLPELRSLLSEIGQRTPGESLVAWLYTPLALPLARAIDPDLVVYDCMDELSAFDFAPPELLQREAELLDQADIVFTGGPSLYRAKQSRHPSVFCFPSSVDAEHFGAARNPLPEPADQAAIPHPRLGFFGVIDERMDRELLAAAAANRPEWQFVLIGPVVKIDPDGLPRHSNIHYLGQRSYSELPAYLSHWDVCLLPFARNRATEFISPTKTLEYMAAAKPIVSTPIADVAQPYGEVVYLGDTAAAFIAACERALNERPPEREARQARMAAIVQQTSWDQTADAMHQAITEARTTA